MNVTISVKGRFHAFYLARELQKHGFLRKLITSYPRFETIKYGINKEGIKSIVIHEIISRLLRKLPGTVKHFYNPRYRLAELFDTHVSHIIPDDTDIFAGWSSMSLKSLRTAGKRGIKTIVKRGSSHMLHQSRILSEEHERWGLTPQNALLRLSTKN